MVALAVDEHAVLEEGMARLAELLGPDFEISLFRVGGGKDNEQDAVAADFVYSIRVLANSAPCAQVVVEAKASLTPAAAQQALLPQVRLLRQLYNQATVLVVAPWLSPRTRDVLASRKVSYLDLTGNVDLRLPTGVLIKTDPGLVKQRLQLLLADPRSEASTRQGLDYLDELFGAPQRQGVVIDALSAEVDADQVRALAPAYAVALRRPTAR